MRWLKMLCVWILYFQAADLKQMLFLPAVRHEMYQHLHDPGTVVLKYHNLSHFSDVNIVNLRICAHRNEPPHEPGLPRAAKHFGWEGMKEDANYDTVR